MNENCSTCDGDAFIGAPGKRLAGRGDEVDDGEGYAGVPCQAVAVGESLPIVPTTEEEDDEHKRDVACGDLNGAAKAAVDDDADRACGAPKDLLIDVVEAPAEGLEAAVESEVLVEGKGDDGGTLELGAGADVFVNGGEVRDGSHGPDRDAAQLLVCLERDDDVVGGVGQSPLVPYRHPVAASLVHHGYSRWSLGELHQMHGVDG